MATEPDDLPLIVSLDNTLRSFSGLRLGRAPFRDPILQRLLVKFTNQECRTLCVYDICPLEISSSKTSFLRCISA